MKKLPKEIQNLSLTVNFIKDGKSVVAYSPALDISTSGKNEVEAKKRFEEIVQIFFEDITERKVINEVLGELGWQKTGAPTQWLPPQVSYKSLQVKVPMFA